MQFLSILSFHISLFWDASYSYTLSNRSSSVMSCRVMVNPLFFNESAHSKIVLSRADAGSPVKVKIPVVIESKAMKK